MVTQKTGPRYTVREETRRALDRRERRAAVREEFLAMPFTIKHSSCAYGLLRHFLPKLLCQFLHFLEILRQVLGQHSFSKLVQVWLHGRAQRREFRRVLVNRLKTKRLRIDSRRFGFRD